MASSLSKVTLPVAKINAFSASPTSRASHRPGWRLGVADEVRRRWVCLMVFIGYEDTPGGEDLL